MYAVHHNSGCVGDAVSTLYAACGLATATGQRVAYHCKQFDWTAGVFHHGLTILASGEPAGADVQADWPGEVAASGRGGCRPGWYCRRVAAHYGLDPFPPARPMTVNRPPAVLPAGYVLLAPFANAPTRTWAAKNWRRLARRLTDAGRRVAAVAGWWQAGQLDELFAGQDVTGFAGEPTPFVLGLVANADAMAANDSGLAHVGGLFGTPTVAAMAGAQPGRWVFGPTAAAVRPVEPDAGGLDAVDVVRVWDALLAVLP